MRIIKPTEFLKKPIQISSGLNVDMFVNIKQGRPANLLYSVIFQFILDIYFEVRIGL